MSEKSVKRNETEAFLFTRNFSLEIKSVQTNDHFN